MAHKRLRRIALGAVACLLLAIAGAGTLAVDAFGVRRALPVEVQRLFAWDELRDTEGDSGSKAAEDGDSADDEVDETFVSLDGDFTGERFVDAKGARAALTPVAKALGIKDVDEELAECHEEEAFGNHYFRFYQSYKDIPVYGRSMVVSSSSAGEALNLSSNATSVEGVETDPSVSREDAVAAARGAADDAEAEVLAAELSIYSLNGVDPRLTYSVELNPSSTNGDRYFIDARTGDIVATEAVVSNATVDAKTKDGQSIKIDVEQTGDDTYQLVDKQRNISVYDAEKKEITPRTIAGSDEHGSIYGILHKNRFSFFVDSSGESLEDAIQSRGLYRLTKKSTNQVVAQSAFFSEIALFTGEKKVQPYSGKASEFVSSESGKAAASLYKDMVDTYNFFDGILDRKGFDGANGQMVGSVRAKLIKRNDGKEENDSDNAYSYYNFMPHISYLSVGYKNSLKKDTVAHEFGHALEQNISSLGTHGESGAIKEAVGDIIGELVEDHSDDGAMNASCNWLHNNTRNIKDPLKSKHSEDGSLQGSHPTRYGDKRWGDPNKTDFDNGYVHNNSTVLSHAFYLMNQGNLPGDSLDTDKLAKLLYLTLMSLPSDCTFSRFRTVAENTAAVMADQGMLTGSEAKRVSAAFDEVKIPPMGNTSSVARNAKLNVFDVNDKSYTAYKATVRAASSVAQGSPQELTPDAKKGLTFNFTQDGAYSLILTDNADDSKMRGYKILVTEQGANSLDLYTNFGMVDKESESSKQAATFASQQNVALVLDVSGSMSDDLSQLKEAADRFVDTTSEGNAKLSLISYADDAQILATLGSSSAVLKKAVDELAIAGSTNIEDGLVAARSVLTGLAGNKTIVLMSDGEANRGKTGDELISYAQQLKDEGIRIFSVGFGLAGGAQGVMRSIASEGRHYEAGDSQSLEGFFQDIADELNGTKFMLVRAACPVDVNVTYDGETLSSAEDDQNLRTSFGSLSFEDEEDSEGNTTGDQIKVLRLKEGASYKVDVTGTGEGSMDYSIGFVDDQGDYSDFRTFTGIPITPTTRVASTAAVERQTTLSVDTDGDGKFEQAFSAGANEEGQLVDNRWLVRLVLAGFVLLFILVMYLRIRGFMRFVRGRRGALR